MYWNINSNFIKNLAEAQKILSNLIFSWKKFTLRRALNHLIILGKLMHCFLNTLYLYSIWFKKNSCKYPGPSLYLYIIFFKHFNFWKICLGLDTYTHTHTQTWYLWTLTIINLKKYRVFSLDYWNRYVHSFLSIWDWNRTMILHNTTFWKNYSKWLNH